MMKKGDRDDMVGRTRTMKGNLNFNIADAFGVKDSS
jgi:calcium-dependent protein kinase